MSARLPCEFSEARLGWVIGHPGKVRAFVLAQSEGDAKEKEFAQLIAAAYVLRDALREERTAKDVLVERVWSIIDDVEAQFDVELNASRCFMHRHGWGEFHRGRKGFEHD